MTEATRPEVLGPQTTSDRTSSTTVGGKALNLGRLLRADLPVPPGFCVTTPAYRRVVVIGSRTWSSL